MKMKRAERWPTGSRGQRKPLGETGKRSQILEGRFLGRNKSGPAALPPKPPVRRVELTHSLRCKINYAGEFEKINQQFVKLWKEVAVNTMWTDPSGAKVIKSPQD